MPLFNQYPVITQLQPEDLLMVFQASTNAVCVASFQSILNSIKSESTNAQVVKIIASDYTIIPTDEIVIANSGAPLALTLPLATAAAGATFPIVNMGASTVTITPSGFDTINGDPTKVLAQFENITLLSTGANLYSG